MPSSLYIHVPFCRAKCAYCDFYSVPLTGEAAQRYVIALRRELQMRARGELGTIYIGGGTPSVLPDDAVPTVLGCLEEHAVLAEGAEVTVEANPESITTGMLEGFSRAGVNRLSLGVQSFDDAALSSLGRPHTAQGAREAIAMASGYPHIRLSLDLMYGLPGQSVQDWAGTLEQAVSARPSHISAYELTPEQGTPLGDMLAAGKIRMPHEDSTLEMFHMTRRALRAAGFMHYEVSNYARPGMVSRHNMNYWRRGEYMGLGPGAVSFLGGVRRRNLPDVEAYCDALMAGLTPPFEQETPTREEEAREFLMLGLRTIDGVSAAEAWDTYGIGLEGNITPLIDEGVLALQDNRLRLTEAGMPVMNTVLVRLFGLLEI